MATRSNKGKPPRLQASLKAWNSTGAASQEGSAQRYGSGHQKTRGAEMTRVVHRGMVMQYPIAIEWGDETTATGIVFPDIPGAISAGDTVAQAYEMAVEVAHIQLKELAEQGQPIPMPSRIEDLKKKTEYAGWGWGIVDIDITPYLGKTEKVNVTLPGVVIRKIDDYVALHGLKSRSAFLASVALEKLSDR